MRCSSSSSATSGWMNLLLLISSAHALRGGNDRHLQQTNCLECHVVHPEVLRESNVAVPEVESLRCLTSKTLPSSTSASSTSSRTSSHFRSSLALEGLPQDLIDANLDALKAGEWHICIEDYTIFPDTHTVLVAEDSKILSLDDDEQDAARRHLQDQVRVGTQRLLAVRVTSAVSGEEPNETLESIEGAIFGTGPNPDNISAEGTVVQQYAAVSHGQLLFQAAEGPSIINGVLEIAIDLPFVGTTNVQTQILPLLRTATEAAVGSSLSSNTPVADKIVYCLPDGRRFSGRRPVDRLHVPVGAELVLPKESLHAIVGGDARAG